MNSTNNNTSCAPTQLPIVDIPQYAPMRALKIWAVATLKVLPDGKVEKRPYQVTGIPAESDNPSTWATFSEAQECATRIGGAVGCFMTPELGIMCFDFDSKKHMTPNKFLPAIDMVGSFTEWSQSVKGFHTFVKGNSKQGFKNTEFVQLFCEKQFIILTGNVFRDLPISDNQEVISRFIAGFSKQRPEGVDNSAYDNGDMKDRVRREFMASAAGMRKKVVERPDYVERTVKNAMAEVAAEPKVNISPSFLANLQNSGKRQLVTRNALEIDAQPVDWIWPGWIAKAFINSVAGESGAGKSTVITDIVSRVTTGAPFPGEETGRPPANVLWLNSEDPPELMTVPRLIATDADRSRVDFIEGAMLNGKSQSISLQDDVESMREKLTSSRQSGKPIAMLIIDPVTSYLSGGALRRVDIKDAGQIRTVLEPWGRIAKEFNIAVVCITHFAKDTNRSMLHRVLGSQAFVALARSTIAVTDLPEAAQNGDQYAKAMFQIKMNLPEHPGGAWRFTTEKTTILNKKLQVISATRARWTELDASLKPNNLAGGERGPVSQFRIGFPFWVKLQFAGVPPDQGLPISALKRKAIAEGVATPNTWEKHSKDFLQKHNIDGIWQCRPL